MKAKRVVVAALAVVVVGGLIVPEDTAEAVPPGMGLDEAREKRLAETTAGMLTTLAGEKPDYKGMIANIVAARENTNALLALAEKTEPAKVDTPPVPERPTVVVPEGATAAQVRDRWREQLVLRVRSVHDMLTGKSEDTLPKWGEAIGVGWRHRNDRTKRARPTAATMREAQVFALLLARHGETVTVKKGDVLFADDFSKGTDNWHLYGPAETTMTDKGLRRRNKRRRNADTMIWTKKEFEGNVLFEFTFIPNNGGRGPGGLFAICGRPVKEGTDLSVSCGETMDAYNHGVHAYHFSMHRGLTGICNGRKVGTGLHLIGSRTPDPARETGKACRVTLGKWGNNVFCLADGVLQHSYYDAGTFGPPLTGGAVGMRHWGGLDATCDDVKVYRLVKEGPSK